MTCYANDPIENADTGHSVTDATNAVSGGIDTRETLYNSRETGPINQIQLPREMVTRLYGLVVDLDANLLKPNPWFPPGDTAEAFYANIRPVLERHPLLQYAEIRDTGRWLHAIVWFVEPVELRTGDDQGYWAGLHKVLMSSVPSDPAAPVLIASTRPVGATNSKTGNKVRTLKAGQPVPASLLEDYRKEVVSEPFKVVGTALFGAARISACPYCRQPGSHLDMGAQAGHCYGACRTIHLRRLFEPFFKASESGQEESTKAPASPRKKPSRKTNTRADESAGPQVITIDGDVVLRIDPTRVTTITIEVRQA
jgi:hypothetical protein